MLGEDRAPNAAEAALHALAACLNTAFVFQAVAAGVSLEALSLTVEGELDLHGFLGLDASVRNGFQNVRVTFHVTSDASDDLLSELSLRAQDRSPVFDIFTHPVPVEVSLQRA